MTVHEYPASHGSLAALQADHHPQYALIVTSSEATRPSSLRFGRIHVASDTGRLSFDSGAGWVDMVTRAEQDALVAEVQATVDTVVAEAEALLPDLRYTIAMEA